MDGNPALETVTVSPEQPDMVERWLVRRMLHLLRPGNGSEFSAQTKEGIVVERQGYHRRIMPFVYADDVSYKVNGLPIIGAFSGRHMGSTHHYDATILTLGNRPVGMYISRKYRVLPADGSDPVEWTATTKIGVGGTITGYTTKSDRGEGLDPQMARDYQKRGDDGISGAARLLMDFAQDVFGRDLLTDQVVESTPPVN